MPADLKRRTESGGAVAVGVGSIIVVPSNQKKQKKYFRDHSGRKTESGDDNVPEKRPVFLDVEVVTRKIIRSIWWSVVIVPVS